MAGLLYMEIIIHKSQLVTQASYGKNKKFETVMLL